MEREDYFIIRCKNYEVSVEFDNDSMRETAINLGEDKIVNMILDDMLKAIMEESYLFSKLNGAGEPITEIHLVIEER